jgi:hypothetical protein
MGVAAETTLAKQGRRESRWMQRSLAPSQVLVRSLLKRQVVNMY